MKWRFVFLFLLAVGMTLAAAPAVADSYNNGPVNGTTDAWPFSGGFQNTQSFTFTTATYLTTFSGWFWIAPGDSLTGVQLSIGTFPFDRRFFNGTLSSPITSNCFSNQYRYQVCDETFIIQEGRYLDAGTYWLTLQNGTTAFGTQPFWDENSGIGCTSPGCPSRAMLNNIPRPNVFTAGTIPSEAFTISGACGPGCSVASDGSGGPVPEPSSLLLVGSGCVGLVALLRRRLF